MKCFDVKFMVSSRNLSPFSRSSAGVVEITTLDYTAAVLLGFAIYAEKVATRSSLYMNSY